MDKAREGGGPTLIELKTYRFHPHTSDDDDRTYRSREEVEEAKRNDSLILFADYLKRQGILDDDAIQGLRAEIKARVDADVEAAWNAPDPEPESALRHVFAEGTQPPAGDSNESEGDEKPDALESTGGEATPADSPDASPGGSGE
jgi:2-oxoisovalerate dehydrogenase E1 component alpha subunit